MRTTLLAPVLAILALSGDEAQACGRRCRCRHGYSRAVVARPYTYAPVAYGAQPYAPVVYYTQAYAPVEAPASSPAPADPTAVQATQATPAGAEAGVRPRYTYEASAENGVAYYYTYNDSGDLIIKQWMDWLFRGGRRAGLPAPPLPIIGRINN